MSVTSSPVCIHLFKFNNENTRTVCQIRSKLTIKTQMLFLNRFHTLFWCFHCWLRTSKCRLGNCMFLYCPVPLGIPVFTVKPTKALLLWICYERNFQRFRKFNQHNIISLLYVNFVLHKFSFCALHKIC